MGFFNKLVRTFIGRVKGDPQTAISFLPSDELMNEYRFWQIIENTKIKSHNDYILQQDLLVTELQKLTPDEMILFANRFRFFRGKAKTWDLLGVAHIINSGCNDDCFTSFREWIISRGQEFYYKTVNDPGSVVRYNSQSILFDWEGIGYIPSIVFQMITGEELPYVFTENTSLKGIGWDEDEIVLMERFPELHAKYRQIHNK